MFTQIINLSSNKKSFLNKLDIRLSMDSFIAHLQRLADTDDIAKREMFEFFLKRFDEVEAVCGPLSEKNLTEYSSILFYIYSLLAPPLIDEREALWALAAPLGKSIFYGTQGLYSFLHQEFYEDSFKDLGVRTQDYDLTERAIYGLILERFYQIPLMANERIEISSKDKATNLLRYYAIDIDRQFVTIIPKGELPELDFASIGLHEAPQFDIKRLQKQLPLSQFRFSGFCIVVVREITSDRVMQNIQQVVSKNSDEELEGAYEVLQESLQTLVGNQHITFGLSSILQLNDKPILDQVYMYSSKLFDLLARKRQLSSDVSLMESYLSNPQTIVYNIAAEFGDHYFIVLDDLEDLQITSYICIPLHYTNKVTGFLEVYTTVGNKLDNTVLGKLRIIAPLLAQLLYDQSTRFRNNIEDVIKEKFTSLQPAVQWKFNQAAYEYLKMTVTGHSKPAIENIQFNNVYPLYGAIDIRNSTVERNKALIADYKLQLELLKQVLQEIKKHYNIVLLDEVEFSCDNLLLQLDISPIDTVQVTIKNFLERDVLTMLQYFREDNPTLAQKIQEYEAEVFVETGSAHRHRCALESSMARINTAINSHLELLNKEIQESYPCYFEKFRTDGVEYDIYIGQSIVFQRNFDELYLKNMRLWQLSSMAAIAKTTYDLLEGMEIELETTQLIFVNGNVIDISFRVDEKRFDVEGAYNIRYQIIKKRIDKVHLKDSTERLTQPRKIALVYYDQKDIKEYIDHIRFLQSKEILLDDMEELELEEMQGVSGLKAIRIGVRL